MPGTEKPRRRHPRWSKTAPVTARPRKMSAGMREEIDRLGSRRAMAALFIARGQCRSDAKPRCSTFGLLRGDRTAVTPRRPAAANRRSWHCSWHRSWHRSCNCPRHGHADGILNDAILSLATASRLGGYSVHAVAHSGGSAGHHLPRRWLPHQWQFHAGRGRAGANLGAIATPFAASASRARGQAPGGPQSSPGRGGYHAEADRGAVVR